MTQVLLDGRWHADRNTLIERKKLTEFVDFYAVGEGLALTQPNIKQPADQQMVDLGDGAFNLDSKVIQDNPILVVGKLNSQIMGCIIFTRSADMDLADL